MVNKMDKYDIEITGEIVEIRDMGFENSPLILVKYKVNDEIYTITEELKMVKESSVKFLFIPIGHRLISIMEKNTGIKPRPGNIVRVKYVSSNPKDAYLPENRKDFSYY
jgi:hypothetical protein